MNTNQQSVAAQDGQAGTVIGRGQPSAGAAGSAALIVNADDWGRDTATTDRTRQCVQRGTVSSVSGMVFMEDSERAAALARLHGVDTGLHLNFTLAFSAASCSPRLREHQTRIARFLNAHRLATAIYHPGLTASFEYVVNRQLDEYERLYGAPVCRVDGHHHMHLCANVLRQRLLPEGIVVRRNLSFRPGEKGVLNRLYRGFIDAKLARRHRLAGYFFDLVPLEPHTRFAAIIELANRFDVEVETHPVREEEYRFLINGGLAALSDDVSVARGYTLRFSQTGIGLSGAALTQQATR